MKIYIYNLTLNQPMKSALIFVISLFGLLISIKCACNTTHPYAYNSQCFQECPWNNTVITYLDNTTNTCIMNCTGGKYADDATKKCVSVCPSEPIKTFKDTIYNRCVQNCSSNPSYHAYNVTSTCVQYCPSPYWALQTSMYCTPDCPLDTYYQIDGSERTCVDICYPNYYANSTRYCVGSLSCNTTGVAYYGDDSTGLCVEKCPVSKGTFADNSTRKCVLYCPLGSFADSTSQICVATCPSVPPYFGSNTTRTCLLICIEGEFADGPTRQCMRRCPTGSYGDFSTRRCVAVCPISRATFADNLTNLCVQYCPQGYYADNLTRSCVASINCSQATFGDPISQACVTAKNCPFGFFVDVSQGLCVVRCTNWGNPINRFCEDVCPWNPTVFRYYKDPSTHICVLKCPDNPRSYGDNDTRSCVPQCPVGTVGNPIDNRCWLTCPSSFYANTILRICVATCTQNTSSILYFFTRNQTCLTSCPQGYFADNTTLACELKCTNHTYGYQPNNTCLWTCPEGFFGDEYTVKCVQSCPNVNGQYADPSTNLCVDMCPENPDLYGENINNDNLTCVDSCSIPGYFADPLTRTCVPACNASAGFYGYTNDWRCYDRCPTGYGNPLNSQCVEVCPRRPKFYYGDNLTRTCVLRCPNETYGDRPSNLCMDALNCTQGTFGDDASGLCVSVCSQRLKLFGDPSVGKCVLKCNYPYYADDLTQLCQPDCSSSANRFMDDSIRACVSTCSSIPDTFGDPNTGACQYNCTNGFFGYANGTKRLCVAMCPSTPVTFADLQNGVCVTKCANQTYRFVNNTFRGCLYVCPQQVYSATLVVDLFADNTTWTCVQTCPYGYYAFKHPTDTSIRTCVRTCPMVGSTYYFGEDQTRKCVTSCSMRIKGFYGDRITFKCVKTCPRQQYRDNSTGLCVYDCQPGFFANNVTWNCSAWCNNEYFAEDINNTCVLYCPTGYYGYKNKCWSQCPNQTYTYNHKDNSSWLCVDRCPAYPDYFADNNTVSCVFRCTSGYYADTPRRVCLPALNCSDTTIADPISGRCVLRCTKQPMYYLTVETNTCGPTCSNGTFAFNQSNLCVDQCPSPYFGYNTTANFYCVQYCPSSQFMWVNGTTRRCISFCPEGLFRDVLTMSCVQLCPDYYYANESNWMCVLDCTPLYADDYSKTCVQTCPDGTTASNNSYRCQDYCDFGEYSLEKVCQISCPYPLFADNLTRSCRASCQNDPLTYADPVNRRCVLTCNATQYAFMPNLTCLKTCPDGYYRELTLLLCLQDCLEGYFADNQTLNCVLSCNTSLYTFADRTTRSCVKQCPNDPDLYGFNNSCIMQCPLGYFAQNITRTCIQVCPNVSSIYPNASWADSLTRRCTAKCSSLSYAYTNQTDNLCLNTCPIGTWASITLQACVVTCPEGSYAYNDTTTCVEECPPGTWADLIQRICMPNCQFNSSLFADDSTYSCVQRCPQFPDMYADPTTQRCVLTCPNTYYAYIQNRTCLQECPAPYFADDQSLQCVLRCPIDVLSYADEVQRKCVTTCYNHTINSTLVQFYADNATMRCVEQCPQSPDKFYGYNLTNLCLQTCPDGTYGDNDTRVCLDVCVFQEPKFTWMDRQTNFCVKTCSYGYYADNKTGFCELTCTNSTYADSSSRRCVYNCPLEPASYAVMINGTGVCVYNCPNGTYSSQVSISCVQTCPTQPFVYYMYEPTNACVKQCIYPFYADKRTNRCTTSCGVGFYGNMTTKTCQICQVQCVTCIGYLVCSSCISGFYLYESTCVVTCPSYPVLYYAHKQSGVCFLTCPAPFFGEVSTQKCQLTCPALTYPSQVTRVCTACPEGCRTCDAVGCYTCFSDYTWLMSALTCNKHCNSTLIYYYNSVCYASCPDGSYLSYDLVNCLSCSSPCATCFGTSGNCTSCIQSYYYMGQCLNACPANFFVNTKLQCQACSTNPSRCTLQPLNYTIYPFTANYQMQAYCVFNRPVNLTLAEFISKVKINYKGVPLKSNQFTATVFNSTTFLVKFVDQNGVSLNQNSLSFSFSPGTITDQYGNFLTSVTVTTTLEDTTGVNTSIAATTQPVKSGIEVLSFMLLALLGLFFIKGGYPALITIEVMQLIYMHIFLFTDPLPYMQYNILSVLKIFHLAFLPSLFPSLSITNSHYSLFTKDISFLSNSPVILVFLLIVLAYLLVGFLSSKKFITNKSIRKFFKRIRKYRMRYGVIHDAFWVCYLYAVFISMLQFKMGDFSSTNAILNMMLAISTFILFFAFTIMMFYLGLKYRKQQQKIPKKYAFLMMQPSAYPLQMPMRYLRKLLLCLALLLTSVQTQGMVMLCTNIIFLSFYACYKPAKSPLTNKIIISLELGFIILISLFIGYDKMITKDINTQQGFSIAMVVVEAIMMIIVLMWAAYRLALVIKETQTWKKIYQKLTENTDPEYLKEQQRKRDLEFDFGSLENRSIEERTQHPMDKVTNKKSVIDEKFNVFDRVDDSEDAEYNIAELEKPLREVISKKKSSRPASVDSSEVMAIRSNVSKSQEIFEPRKSAQNYTKKGHLQVRENEDRDDLEQINLSDKKKQPNTKGLSAQDSERVVMGVSKPRDRVLWQELDIDEDDI